MTDYSEFDAMKEIDSALTKIDDDARARVLVWVGQKFGTKVVSSPIGPAEPPANESGKPAAKKTKSAKKTKVVLSQIKDLNLQPTGQPSAKDFVAAKSPTSMVSKSVVAVYYLRDMAKVPSVTVDHVYTFFKMLGWPLPADLKNTLQQAGTLALLDTADSQNIKLTVAGENHVEHELPAKKA